MRLRTIRFLFVLLIIVSLLPSLPAQTALVPVVKETRKADRVRLYKSLQAGINRDLSLPLADSTEENWMDAFYSIELLRYRSPWVENRLHQSFAAIDERSIFFQRSLAEMLYDSYPLGFEKEMMQLCQQATDIKLFALTAEYLLKIPHLDKAAIQNKLQQWLLTDSSNAILCMLKHRLEVQDGLQKTPPLKTLLHQSFFGGAKVVFSFQRHNRNYPGLVLVRDSAAHFLKNDDGNYFSVPQLARSISNLPGYISNGNTPQGIFRMHGMAVSRSVFIGPTPNIQLTMPGETSICHFTNDSTIADSAWSLARYTALLPAAWQNYFPVYESYFAGKAGRTEIIAHGTTVDPAYYKGQSYFPFTPTLGCLCTKELWSEADGSRQYSDQQKLVDAVQKAGGAEGYYVVVDIDDQQRPVELSEILPYLY